jgi:hypothetical protein
LETWDPDVDKGRIKQGKAPLNSSQQSQAVASCVGQIHDLWAPQEPLLPSLEAGLFPSREAAGRRRRRKGKRRKRQKPKGRKGRISFYFN